MWHDSKRGPKILDFPVKGSWARCSIGAPEFYIDGKLQHDWYFIVQAPNEADLWLKPSTGLVKWITSKVTDVHEPQKTTANASDIARDIREQMPDVKIIESTTVKTVEIPAAYDECTRFLDYALRRFEEIATEVPKYVTWACNQRGAVYSLNKQQKQNLRGYWRRAENEILAAFYGLFCKSMVDNEQLTLQQKTELIQKATPLKRTHKQVIRHSIHQRECVVWGRLEHIVSE